MRAAHVETVRVPCSERVRSCSSVCERDPKGVKTLPGERRACFCVSVHVCLSALVFPCVRVRLEITISERVCRVRRERVLLAYVCVRASVCATVTVRVRVCTGKRCENHFESARTVFVRLPSDK